MTVVDGRNGTDGQFRRKTFALEDEARRKAGELAAEKTERGHTPV
jgi:predicted DNA-binding WGR domain protein